MGKWTLLSNHGHVLVSLANNSEARLRDVALDVGITERAVQKIVRDLQDGGMISVRKNGRRNCYRIHKKQTLRHRLEAQCTLRDFLSLARKPVKRKRHEKPAAKPSAAIGIEALKPPSKPKPEKPVTSKPETVEPTKPDNIDRQQGSLF